MSKKDIFKEMIEEETSTKQRLFYSAVYLFSTKGYANVGIRELCSSVNIKGSAFYNHYSSKEELFKRILSYFTETSNEVIFTDEEIEDIAATGDIKYFFEENMKKFANSTNTPLYQTILQIVFMESYTNEEAFNIEKNNLYYLRKGYTEKVLKKMMDKGYIRTYDIEVVTAEYYYGLKGLLDEYLLLEVWNQDTSEIMRKIHNHIHFFAELLKK